MTAFTRLLALGAFAMLAILGATPGPVAAQIRTTTETLGPVALGDGPDRAIVVEATYETLDSTPAEGWERTLTRLRFRTRAGRLLYQETLRTEGIVGSGFDSETVAGPVRELRGASRRFLLLTLGFSPSTPTGGNTLHVYGFDRKGRFRRLGSALDGPGATVVNPEDPAGNVVRLRDGKYLDVSEWTGHLTLVLPRVFNGTHEAFELASLCGTVKVEPRKPEASATVTLHRTTGTVPNDLRWLRPFTTVPVSPASKIEFLEGCRRYGEAHTGQYVSWVRVKVDGMEGWVSGDGNDLDKLGLPAAD
jgi:hypothetical protein